MEERDDRKWTEDKCRNSQLNRRFSWTSHLNLLCSFPLLAEPMTWVDSSESFHSATTEGRALISRYWVTESHFFRLTLNVFSLALFFFRSSSLAYWSKYQDKIRICYNKSIKWKVKKDDMSWQGKMTHVIEAVIADCRKPPSFYKNKNCSFELKWESAWCDSSLASIFALQLNSVKMCIHLDPPGSLH